MNTNSRDRYRLLWRWAKDEEGVAATEYAILLSLIIVGSMGVIGNIGAKFAVLYQVITGSLPEGM